MCAHRTMILLCMKKLGRMEVFRGVEDWVEVLGFRASLIFFFVRLWLSLLPVFLLLL